MRWLMMIAILLYVSGAAAPRPGNHACAAVAEDQLTNGMRIILDPDGTAPLVAVMVAVRAGSSREAVDTHGFTHLLEHMLFDGTTRSSREQISRRIEQAGGYLNAFTRKDHILFMAVMPKDNTRIGLETLAEMLFESTLPVRELEKERKVVLEELAKDAEAEHSRVSELIDNALLAGTPYARSISGTPAAISSASRDVLQKFYSELFVPANMTFIAVGDFDPPSMTSWAEEVFGKRPAGKAQPAAAAYQAEQGRRTVREVEGLMSDYTAVLVPLPPRTHPDSAAASLAVSLFADGEDAPLTIALAAADVPLLWSGVEFIEHPGLSAAIVQLVTGPGSGSAAEAVMSAQLLRLPSLEIDGQRLSRLQARLRADSLLDLEKFDHRGWAYAAADLIGGVARQQWWEAQQQLADASRVSDAARTHLAGVVPSRCSIRAAAPLEEQAAHPGPAVRKVLDNGLTIIIQANPSRPIFAAAILVRGRSAHEPPELAGLTQVTLDMLQSGGGAEPRQFKADMAALGARFETADNPFIPMDDYLLSPFFGFIHVQAPAQHGMAALRLVTDCLSAPHFPAEALSESVANLTRRSAMEAKKPTQQFARLIHDRLPGGQSFGHPLFGAPASLTRITRDDVVAHAARILAPANLIVAVHGDVDPDEIERLLSDTLGSLETAEGWTPPPAPQLPAFPEAEVTVETEAAGERALAGMARYLPADESRRVRLIMLAEWLDQQMAQRIRETEGLAYSLGAGIERFPGGALLTLAVPTRSGNEQRVFDLLTGIVRDLPANLPSEQQLEDLKAQIWGRHIRYRQRRIIVAHFLAERELWTSGANLPAFDDALAQCTTADIAAEAAVLASDGGWFRAVLRPSAR